MLTLRICYVAALKSHLGFDSEDIPCENPVLVASVLGHLATRHPQHADLLAKSRLATATEFIQGSIPWQPGLELTVIPPVSGG